MLTIQKILAMPNMAIAVHNVQLLKTHCGHNGYEMLIVKIGDAIHELNGGALWSDQRHRSDLGKFGYLEPYSPLLCSQELPVGACYFRPYYDQSLRRVPELDCHIPPSVDAGRAFATVGWLCDTKPDGFRAPLGLIPGEHGCFIPDETDEVTLRVPPEFLLLCRRMQITPEDLLSSFVGDLAAIRNYATNPRADGYSSNGGDERDLADAWLHRTHGAREINLDEIESAEVFAQDPQDTLLSLLDDFQVCGGDPDELIAAVTAIVKTRRDGQ